MSTDHEPEMGLTLWKGEPCHTIGELLASLRAYVREKPGVNFVSFEYVPGLRLVERAVGTRCTTRVVGDHVIQETTSETAQFLALQIDVGLGTWRSAIVGETEQGPLVANLSNPPQRFVSVLETLDADALLWPPIAWQEDAEEVVPEHPQHRVRYANAPPEPEVTRLRRRIALSYRRCLEATGEVSRRYRERQAQGAEVIPLRSVS